MSLQVGELYAAIDVDQAKFDAGLKQAENKFKGLSTKFDSITSKMKNIGGGLTAGVTLPVVGAAAASFKLASDMSESINKVDVAFKDSSQGVKDWAATTLNTFGIAKGTSLDMAATYGDMATSMGLTTEQASAMSTSMVGLAGDLASFKNIGIDIADTALTGIFTGETESLKQLGIVMTQVNLEEYAASQGIKKKIKDMTQAEQVQLRYAYVMDKTKNAQGDFARTQDGAANQMRIFSESLKELGASFGENLLPVITPIIQGVNNMVKAFGNLSPGAKKIITVVALVAAAVGPLLLGFGLVAGAITSIAGVMPILGTAFAALAGPVGIAIAIILGVVAVGYLVYKNWDKISKQLAETWQWIKEKASKVFGGLKQFFGKWGLDIIGVMLGPIGVLAVQIYKHWDSIKAYTVRKWTDIKTWLVNFVTGIKTAVSDKISGVSTAITNAWTSVKNATISAWGEIKGFITGAIDAIVRTISGLFDKLDQLKLKAKGAKEGVGWNFNGSGSTMSYASGTDFHPGGLAWVGERGPELVNLPRGSQVFTNSQSMAMGNQSLTVGGTIRVEGVNNQGQVVGVAKIVAKEIEQGDRRLAGRVRVMPSMA